MENKSKNKKVITAIVVVIIVVVLGLIIFSAVKRDQNGNGQSDLSAGGQNPTEQADGSVTPPDGGQTPDGQQGVPPDQGGSSAPQPESGPVNQ